MSKASSLLRAAALVVLLVLMFIVPVTVIKVLLIITNTFMLVNMNCKNEYDGEQCPYRDSYKEG